jgi:hypothetical protein
MAQLNYSYEAPRGIPGGLYDIAPYQIDSFANGEVVAGALKFGMGVVQGDAPGVNVAAPTAAATADVVEGVAMAQLTTQHDFPAGNIVLRQGDTVGVLRYGKAWVRVDDTASIEYGDKLYLITSGANAGLFTNDDGELALAGRFVDVAQIADGIAGIELYNAPAPAAAE